MKKLRDGVILTLIRDDGTLAIQKTRHGGFFAIHDLLHYAVEVELNFNQAFLGLMNSGCDFTTFGDRQDPRHQPLPAEALWTEHLISILSNHAIDTTRADPELRELWTDEVNTALAACLTESRLPPFRISPDQLSAITTRFKALMDHWLAVPIGEHLELTFVGGLRGGRLL